MKRSKRFLVTTFLDLNKENIDEFMKGLGCMHYYAVFHPTEIGTNFLSMPHCHIYVKFDEKVDSFFVNDYFGSRCSVDIPKDRLGKIFAHLSHFGKYKVIVDGEEIEVCKD